MCEIKQNRFPLMIRRKVQTTLKMNGDLLVHFLLQLAIATQVNHSDIW